MRNPMPVSVWLAIAGSAVAASVVVTIWTCLMFHPPGQHRHSDVEILVFTAGALLPVALLWCTGIWVSRRR